MDTFVELLKTYHLKVTQQRLEILSYIESHLTHPTADEIHQSLIKKYPSLSKTTIYNTLETLTDSGIIQRLTICPTEHRYDFNHDMHHHFICKKCGKIIDVHFACPNIKTIEKEILKNGHHIEEVHGYFRGICKDCLNKEGAKNG